MNPGLERIKVLSSEITDAATKKIIDYLLTRADMDDKYLNEEKTLKQMILFIRDNAKKKAQNNMAIVEDEEVYNWAIHYFDETNEALGLNKAIISKSNVKIEEEQNKNTEIKNEEPKKIETKKKNWVPEGQLSLFDF